MTETAAYADVVLPGVSYAEKEGTFTNTERRLQRVRKAVEPAGLARDDIQIFCDVMGRMGYPCHYDSAAQVMDEIACVTPSYGGISHARLDAGESLQWPCPSKDHPGYAPFSMRADSPEGLDISIPLFTRNPGSFRMRSTQSC